jgi:copper chaperone
MSEKIELNVTGMTCDHCVRSITNAVNGLPGVTQTNVDLKQGRATVEGEGLDAARIIAAIEDEGYEATVRN